MKKKILLHNMTFKGIHVVPGVINYDQRGIVFADKGDIVITNNTFDRDYLQYLSDLGYEIDSLLFIHPNSSTLKTWNSIFTSKEVKKALSQVDREKYFIDVYIPTELDGRLSRALNFDHCNNWNLSEKYGTKSGFRLFASEAGLPIAKGFSNVKTVIEVKKCIKKLFKTVDKIVIKVDDGISGYGNTVISKTEYEDFISDDAFFEHYLKPIRWDIVGKGVVEAWIEGGNISSSILLHIENDVYTVVCHQDQLLVDGDKWAGCLYPHSMKRNSTQLEKLMRYIDRSAKYLIEKGFWGYYSFDTLETIHDEIYFIEANMRKIGSFYPRVFLEKAMKHFGFSEIKAYIASDYTNMKKWGGKQFSDLQKKLLEYLWPINGLNQGILLYNVGALPEGGRFDFVTVSDSLHDAHELRKKVLNLLDK